MSGSVCGRLDRTHYWIVIVAAMGIKTAVHQFIGGPIASNLGMGLEFFIAATVIARLHDLEWPTWVGALLAAIFILIAPATLLLLYGQTGLGVAVLLMGAFLVIAGSLPGDEEHNAYGPAGQGFGGLNRLQPSAPVATPASRRLSAISGRR